MKAGRIGGAGDEKEVLVFYQKEGQLVLFLDLLDLTVHAYRMHQQFKLNRVFLPTHDLIIVEDAKQEGRLFMGHWRLTSPLVDNISVRWASLQRSPLLELERPSSPPTCYDFMSTEARSATFLSYFDPSCSVPAYAGFVTPNLSSSTPLAPVGRVPTFVIHSFPRPTPASQDRVLVRNEKALYLRHSDQLLTLVRQDVHNKSTHLTKSEAAF